MQGKRIRLPCVQVSKGGEGLVVRGRLDKVRESDTWRRMHCSSVTAQAREDAEIERDRDNIITLKRPVC